jgi:psiF repeat-containing protein
MKTLFALAIASVIGLATTAAYADDVAPRSKVAKVQPTAAAPAAPTKISQQDKMRLCAKQATGKKGAERKTFMKGCLSRKA